MTENNDYKVSEDCLGWNLFIKRDVWEWFEKNLNKDALGRLSECRTSMAIFRPTSPRKEE